MLFVWIVILIILSAIPAILYWYFKFKRKDIKNKGKHICKICGRDGYQKSKSKFDGTSIDMTPSEFLWKGDECPDCKRSRHFSNKTKS